MNINPPYCSTFNFDSSETVAYNNPLFPFYIRDGMLSSYPDYSAVSHWHNDLEFIIIRNGHMTYNVNGELIELSEGNGIMVNSRQLHYGFSPTHNECEFICILLSPSLLSVNDWFYQNYIEAVTMNPFYPYLYLDNCDWRNGILEELNMLYLSSQSDNNSVYFSIIGSFMSIMKILYENLNIEQGKNIAPSNDLTALKDMLTYIENNFPHHITLENIAFSGACCKSRCSLLFKKYLRETPMIYIAKFRLQKSLSALLNTDKSVTDIAYEYGFCSASYYCETFQKYYGTSPLKYRNKR
jgi:AraC-like DNA-binding protein